MKNNIKNVNCGYALVENMIFSSIRDAEVYCNSKGIDVGRIKYDDRDVLNECKMIAGVTLPLLEEIKEHINRELYSARDSFNKTVRARDEEKNRNQIGWDMMSEELINRAIGTLEGIYRCLDILYTYIHMIERVYYQR